MTNILPKVTKRVFQKGDHGWPVQFTSADGSDWVTDRYAIIRRDAIRKASTFTKADDRYKLDGVLAQLQHDWAREASVVSVDLVGDEEVPRYRLTDSTGETTSINARYFTALAATGATPRIIHHKNGETRYAAWFDDDNLVALVMYMREPK